MSAGTTAATFTADAYNPLYYFLENRDNQNNWYYNYFWNLTFMNDLRWPIPAFWNVYKYGYTLEFWSAVLGWPLLEFIWMFCIALIVPSILLGIYFYYRYLNITGFEGFEWNFESIYQDSDIKELSW